MNAIHPFRTSSYIALGAALFWGCRWRLLPSIGVAAAVGLVVEQVLKKRQKIPLPEGEPSTYSDWVIIEGEPLPPCELLDDSFVMINVQTTAELVAERAGTLRPCFQHNDRRVIALTQDTWVEVGDHLGRGYIKNVYAGSQHGKRVAVGLVNLDNREAIERERELRRRLPDSPFLAELFEVFVLKPYIVTVAPRHSPTPLQPQSARYILTGFVHVTQGLKLIHERRMVHTDVKPQNILWHPEGARLTDFEMKKEGDAVGNRATPRYIPPEYGKNLREGKVYMPGDIWAFGMTFQQVFFGKDERLNAPVDQIRRADANAVESVMRAIIREGQAHFYDGLGSDPNMAMGDGVLEAVKALRNAMLVIEPSGRPTIQKIVPCLERITRDLQQ